MLVGLFDKPWHGFVASLFVLTEIVAGGLIAPLGAQEASASLSVNMSTVIQDDFLGVNAVYHGFAFMPEQIDKGMNDADRAREFDRVQRIGLNIARTWYHPNYACSTSLWDNCDWDSTRMQALYSWLQAMKDRNADVVGDGYSTTFTLGNTGATAVSGNLFLTDQRGNPFDVNITDLGSGSSFPVSIPPGGTAFLTANSLHLGDLQKSGRATVETLGGSLSGVATFEFAPQGVIQAAAVLAS